MAVYTDIRKSFTEFRPLPPNNLMGLQYHNVVLQLLFEGYTTPVKRHLARQEVPVSAEMRQAERGVAKKCESLTPGL